MLIPWNTNAPVYYFPWATIGLIVVNTIVFVAELQNPDDFAGWVLVFGDGLHPGQWLTNNFLHAGIVHLLGNMIFLWSFGLVVEGKLGWWRFVPLYLAICVIYGMVLQIGMLGSAGGGALGASGAIFGLLAIAMIWAPRNEFSCVLILGRIFMFDLPILTFAFLYLLLQFGYAWWGDFSMSSEVLHLTGAAIGAAAGVVLLRTGLVDCEGWDLFAVLRGREGESADRLQHAKLSAKTSRTAEATSLPAGKPPAEPPPPRQPLASRKSEALDQLRTYLQQGNPAAALALDRKMTETTRDWQLPEAELLALIKVLHREKSWQASMAPMVQYVKRFGERAAPMRLRLAQILLVDQGRPHKALSVLEKIAPDQLNAEQTAMLKKLQAEARRRLDDADLEVEDEDW